MPGRFSAAVRRAAPYALSIFLTYVVAATVGITMVHAGNQFALSRRDAIVAAASGDRITIDYRAGRRVRAALTDAAANFGMAALPQTIAGLTVVLPYITVSQQAWIGGIVSVDRNHRSRLRSPRGAAYYLGVLLLQFAAFSLCIGGGVRCGVDLYRHNREAGWRLSQFRLPSPLFVDLACVVVSSIPLFLLASSFEFLSSWN